MGGGSLDDFTTKEHVKIGEVNENENGNITDKQLRERDRREREGECSGRKKLKTKGS